MGLRPALIKLLVKSAFLALLPLFSEAAEKLRSPYLAHVGDLTWGDRNLTVVVIESHWTRDDVSGAALPNTDPRFKLGESFVKAGEKHVSGIYAKRYPERASEDFFKAMFEKNPLFDSRSQLILLYEGRDFSQLLGTLKSTWKNSEHDRLPSPELFDWNLPNEKLRLQIMKDGRQVVRGGSRELKTFTMLNPAGDDLVPVLVAAAQRFGVLSSNQLFIPFQDSAEGEFWRKLGHITAAPFIDGHANGILPESGVPVFARPETYYLSCDPKLVPYYRSMGFHRVNGYRSADGSVWMQVKESTVRGWLSGELKNRPGRKRLPEMTFQIQFLPVLASSRRSLGDFELFRREYAATVRDPSLACKNLLSHSVEPLDPELRIPPKLGR